MKMKDSLNQDERLIKNQNLFWLTPQHDTLSFKQLVNPQPSQV